MQTQNVTKAWWENNKSALAQSTTRLAPHFKGYESFQRLQDTRFKKGFLGDLSLSAFQIKCLKIDGLAELLPSLSRVMTQVILLYVVCAYVSSRWRQIIG